LPLSSMQQERDAGSVKRCSQGHWGRVVAEEQAEGCMLLHTTQLSCMHS
jgi:hypothetical protein